ncbi:MAG: hypothetical protein ABIN15_04280 [candidate division WOR-3 bacterium]
MLSIILTTLTLLSEGFEGGVIPPKWHIGNGGNLTYSWRIAQYGEYFPVEPPQEGLYYVVCDTNHVIYQDSLITPSIDLPTNLQGLKLYYNVSFMKDTIIISKGEIIIRPFSGGTWGPWTVLKTYGGNGNPVFENQIDSINLQAYVSYDSIKIGFVYSKPAQDTGFFMIDFIKVEAKLSGDVGVKKILSPLEYFEPNTPTPVIIEYENFSNTPQIFYVKSEIRDSSTNARVYRDSSFVSIGPLKKDTVQLNNFTGSSQKTYRILAWTQLSGDPDPSNDTVKAYSTTKPFFGAIIKEIPLPRNDSAFQDITFKTNENSIYIVNSPRDTVFAINENGNIISKYKLIDLSQGSTFDNPFGIYYDIETGTFYTSQLGISGTNINWCYIVHYTPNFNLIDSFNLVGKGVGLRIFALSNAQGSNLCFVHRAIFPSKYRIYKLDLSNEISPKIDSITLTQPLYFIAGALEAVNDTIFISAGLGSNKINLFTKSGNILGDRTFDDEVRGICVERRQIGEYINAYVNIGGYKLYKISTGLKWVQNINEKTVTNISLAVPTFIKDIKDIRRFLKNPEFFDISGRKSEPQKINKVIFIKDKNKTHKVILVK